MSQSRDNDAGLPFQDRGRCEYFYIHNYSNSRCFYTNVLSLSFLFRAPYLNFDLLISRRRYQKSSQVNQLNWACQVSSKLRWHLILEQKMKLILWKSWVHKELPWKRLYLSLAMLAQSHVFKWFYIGMLHKVGSATHQISPSRHWII